LIAGYALKERIGAGGYGEVWRAEAPGGLAKAVKFVYGYLDDQRASAELKALSRIKEVRHPFLLSLERIEIIDGQLMIVTELADFSLKDRYDRCRESGSGGIARDELLQYLQDAAEALDYMSQRHSLQHLDVKPENLLILSDRVKVADFGLVKNIQDVTVSMPTGLTPIYAAPEVFDGCPSLHSDQYSLAIVYQEMLTGTLPFPGRTPAQLAAQHLNSNPRLIALPTADRDTIARALAKKPGDRFPTCREMIDSLKAASRTATTVASPMPAGPATGESEVPTSPTVSQVTLASIPRPAPDAERGVVNTTMAIDRGSSPFHAPPEAPAAPLAPEPEEPSTIRDLPPVDVPAADYRFRPTLVIGIGGTASHALVRLRRRLGDRFEDISAVPSIATLLLDTDVKTLSQSSQQEEPGALKPHETIALPLRRCQDYRDDSERLLLWLSRRWLYNIPRSLQTEGLRPLGRLAFIDRARSVLEQIQAALTAIMAPSALNTSRQAVGLEVSSDYPRVIIVASISGGTGSGMVLDVAYAVRKVLNSLGLPHDGLCGLLVHSTGRNPAQQELAAANAYSCLSELTHYSRTRRYPGDPDGLLPAIEGSGPFAQTYLVHLGDDLDDRQFDTATDELASYLYLSTVTGAGSVFEKCRQESAAEGRPPSSAQRLRTFAVCQVGCSQTGLPTLATAYLNKRLIERWSGVDDQFETIGRLATQHAAELRLGVDQLMEQTHQFLEKQSGRATNGEAYNLVQPLLEPSQRTALTTYLEELAAQQSKRICDWIMQLADDPKVRVRGAQQAAQWFAEHLRALEADVGQLLSDAQERLSAAAQKLASKKIGWHSSGASAGRSDDEARLVAEQNSPELAPHRLRQAMLEGILKFTRSVGRQIAATSGRLSELKRELNCLSDEFKAPSSLAEAAAAAQDVPASILAPLEAQIPEILQQLDQQFETSFFAPHDGLSCLLARDARLLLLARMRAATRTAVLHALKQINLTNFFSAPGPAADGKGVGLNTCLDMATPRLLACGAAKRLLLVIPENANRTNVEQAVQQQLHQPPTVVVDSDGDIVLCQEAEQLSPRAVAAYLADQREQVPQLAARLHTRVDVTWTPLA
jgi:serine/threonine protein kinase